MKKVFKDARIELIRVADVIVTSTQEAGGGNGNGEGGGDESE